MPVSKSSPCLLNFFAGDSQLPQDSYFIPFESHQFWNHNLFPQELAYHNFQKYYGRQLPTSFCSIHFSALWLQFVILLEYQDEERHNLHAVSMLPSPCCQSAGLLLKSQLCCCLVANSTFLSCFQFYYHHNCHWLSMNAVFPPHPLVFAVIAH